MEQQDLLPDNNNIFNNSEGSNLIPMRNKIKGNHKFYRIPNKKFKVYNVRTKHGIKYIRRQNGGPYPIPKGKSKLKRN